MTPPILLSVCHNESLSVRGSHLNNNSNQSLSASTPPGYPYGFWQFRIVFESMDSCQANLFWFSRLIGFREPGRMLLNLCTVSSGSYPAVPIDKFSFRFHVLPNKRQLIFLTCNRLQIQFIPKGFYMHVFI
jgi:hypothetical protein